MTSKKLLSILICLVMVLSLMPMAAFATVDNTGDVNSGTTVSIANCTVTLTDKVVYTGVAQEPTVTVKNGDTALTQGTDYNVQYTNNVNAGTATVTITGIGNYNSQVTRNFQILRKDLTITVDNKQKTFGDADPTFTGTVSDVDLKNGDIVTFSCTHEENVGQYTITASITSSSGADVKGNYSMRSGSQTTGTFTITAKDLSSATIGGVEASYVLDSNNSAINPTVTSVTVDGKALTAGTDYDVSYGDNNAVGTGSVTVTGTKNYTGTATKTFAITQAATQPAQTSKTAVKITVDNQKADYGDNIDPSKFTYSHSGVKAGHNLQATLTVNFDGNINVSSAKVVDNSGNDVSDQYDITYTPGKLTINPVTLTVRANDKNKELNAADPALDFTVTGLVGEDTAADVFTGALQCAKVEQKGTYAINKGTLAIKSEYQNRYNKDFTFIPGRFVIGGTFLNVTTQPQTITYGQSVSSNSSMYTYSGLASGHTLASITLAPSTTNVGTGTVEVSSFKVTDSTGKDVSGDYTLNVTKGTLTVNPKEVTSPTIKLERASYGYTSKAVTPTVTAVYDGNTLIPATEYTVSYENNTNLGNGIVRITDKAGGNYTVSGYTTFSIVSNVQYKVVMGNGGCWYRGSYYGLGFRCDGPYAEFLGITIDGREVDKSYYMASEGSTNVGLYPQLLNLLGDGTHYITFHYTSGSATGVFYVGSTAINAVMTGDDSNAGLLALVMCLGLLGSATVLMVLRKKKGV